MPQEREIGIQIHARWMVPPSHWFDVQKLQKLYKIVRDSQALIRCGRQRFHTSIHQSSSNQAIIDKNSRVLMNFIHVQLEVSLTTRKLAGTDQEDCHYHEHAETG
jgi:hypothetical protein